MKESSSLSTWSPVICAVVAGLVIATLGVLFTGAGHGWGSALYSGLSLIGAPLAGFAWAFRGAKSGKIYAALACFSAFGIDLLLWRTTKDEGFYYFHKVWNTVPPFFILWAVLFVGWQLTAISVFFIRPKA